MLIPPLITNTDPKPSFIFSHGLKNADSKISMDGKGMYETTYLLIAEI